ncbi:anthranilate synthase component II [Thermoactinomyces mirandus]|uniref:Aminodeoxychorismate/anthranilate synthase component II n=1 Tax=Thermoactinomyces mirandus TaxID=2756294 RepID=A0A7W1XQN4_9BACL|nr:aminodeoxychorismate/anthranilate synthase component II [Thermoactinomyces mirandus]MBA4601270.1 aminodeoxychorismate/anthranilate synthase component II [Thermoactinomyces mirandus]
MILVVDNYDSFTYNLVQYLGELGEEIEVVRNDTITVDEINERKPEKIVLSPGPGTPDQAGICLDLIKSLSGQVPILGVCLGHQAIAQAFGGKVIQANRLMHGKTSRVSHDGRSIFQGIPSPITVARYHSLIVSSRHLSNELEISAETDQGEIMAIRHRYLPIEGVQFHPESILSEYGRQILANFIQVKTTV